MLKNNYITAFLPRKPVRARATEILQLYKAVLGLTHDLGNSKQKELISELLHYRHILTMY